MIAHAAAPLRRGACPGLSMPMPTGDGLLVRLYPTGTIALAAFTELCRAAHRHGNGVVEITSRGNFQIRGLGAQSAPRFAADVAALGIATDDGVPIVCSPLAGVDAEEIFDCAALAAELRDTPVLTALATRLNAKVSVAIDGGGVLGLADLSADVRLHAQQANGDMVLRVGVGGDRETAANLGNVAAHDGVDAVIRLLEVIARRGRAIRARDIISAEGGAVFNAALADILARPREGGDPELDSRSRGNEREAIGVHALRDGSFACGLGLSFGHSDATTLEQLIEAAHDAGANGFRAAPGHALLAIGVPRTTTAVFAATAEKLGFIVRADDPRRNVFACAGAPICAAAHIGARAMAPEIAASAALFLDRAMTIHVSGCAKGCARAAPATLTIVGVPEGCALIAGGSARDAPFALVAEKELPEAIARLAGERMREPADV